MAIPITVLNDNGQIYLMDGHTGHPLGPLAEARQRLKAALQEYDRRDIIRAVVRRLRDSGLDLQTATLAQIKAAIEGSQVDV